MTMEKEVGLLRCSKLNCYAEFNTMVQALSHSKQPTIRAMPGTRTMLGTSTEYNFYTTLLTMLQQVMSNSRIDSQKGELQRVYEWFRVNKPLVRGKVKSSAQRPRVSFSSRRTTVEPFQSSEKPSLQPFERPQTAPALLHQNISAAGAGSRWHTRPATTFTSAYASRSLGQTLNFIGQSFDQLESITPAAQERPSPSSSAKPKSGSTKSSLQVSVQAHPSPDFLVDYVPPGFSGVQPHMTESVCFGEVFSHAPSVAAQMTLDSLMLPEDENELSFLRKRLVTGRRRSRASIQSVTPPQPTADTRNSLRTISDTRNQKKRAMLDDDHIPPPSYSFCPMKNPLPTSKSGERDGMEQNCQGVEEVGQTPVGKGHDGVQLETIAEVDGDVISTQSTTNRESGVGGGGDLELRNREKMPNDQHNITVQIQEKEGGGPTVPGEESEGDNFGRSGKEEQCLLESTSNRSHHESNRLQVHSSSLPAAGSAKEHSRRHPAVVSLTFPTAKMLPNPTSPTPRRPKKTPTVVAGFKRRRYQRPQTVPLVKLRTVQNLLI